MPVIFPLALAWNWMPRLTALAAGGVYAYGASNAFPSNTFNASNYWVDVVYTP